MKKLEADAEQHHTACGDGTMVWRRWAHQKIDHREFESDKSSSEKPGSDKSDSEKSDSDIFKNGDTSSGKPVVLLHGGSGSWTHWIKTIPVLRKSYEVWAIDIPGLGDSAMPAEPFTPQSCADAVASGFKQFFAASRPATLVCFSFGCHVGTLAASTLNDRLSGVIIIGSAALGLGRAQGVSLPKERRSMTDGERRAVHHSVLANLMFTDSANIDDQAVALQTINVAKARFRSREFADTTDVRDGLARVTVPVKSIWGRDDIVAYPHVDACLDAIGIHHPELEHRVIERAGHWVMYEAAEAFNTALVEFLPD